MDIFKDKTEMCADPSHEVVRTAMTSMETPSPRLPGERKNPDAKVVSVERPRFGHGY